MESGALQYRRQWESDAAMVKDMVKDLASLWDLIVARGDVGQY